MYGRGAGWGADGDGAETPHTNTPVSLSDLQRAGRPTTPPEPDKPPQAGNSRPACARAGASSLGLSSVHRNIPMRPLGIKRKKETLRTGADSSGSGTGDPNQRGDRIKEELP